MDVSVETEPSGEGWLVRMVVSLSREETNELFIMGDKLVSWPTDGMISGGGNAPLDRGNMFLSEIVSKAEGLELLFEEQTDAARVAEILRYQANNALPEC